MHSSPSFATLARPVFARTAFTYNQVSTRSFQRSLPSASPLSVWGIFVATILALLAFPALFVSGIMMLFDQILGTSFFMPELEQGAELQNMVARAPTSPPYSVKEILPPWLHSFMNMSPRLKYSDNL